MEMMGSLGYSQFVIVGHSFGSIAGVTLAHLYPERVVGLMNIAGMGLRFYWGLAQFIFMGLTSFFLNHGGESTLESVLRNRARWTHSLLKSK